jgi:hypothetical protein
MSDSKGQALRKVFASARQRLGVRQTSGALGTDGAHFRRDIAAKALQ